MLFPKNGSTCFKMLDLFSGQRQPWRFPVKLISVDFLAGHQNLGAKPWFMVDNHVFFPRRLAAGLV